MDSLLSLRVLLLSTTVVFVWKALTPPHTSSTSERLPLTSLGRFAIAFVPLMKVHFQVRTPLNYRSLKFALYQTLHALGCLFEIFMILSHCFHDIVVFRGVSLLVFPSQSTCVDARAFNIRTPFLIGSILAILGAQLRLSCYGQLGRLFTFEMAVRKDHELITTGPYAYVRHPAYSGLIMTLAGSIIIQCGTASWLQVHGFVAETVIKAYITTLIVSTLLVSFSATRRGWSEDKVLQARFRDKWSKWAEQTPYRMVPFVY